MKKLKLYLETSLFGFVFDDKDHNKEKKEAVLRLFAQIRDGLMNGFVSGLVTKELLLSPQPLADAFLDIIHEYGIHEFIEDENEAESLAAAFLRERIVPERFRNDAFHVAIAVSGEFDVLVTLNCVHIANEFKARGFRAIQYREGYARELSIRTPMEMIQYEH